MKAAQINEIIIYKAEKRRLWGQTSLFGSYIVKNFRSKGIGISKRNEKSDSIGGSF